MERRFDNNDFDSSYSRREDSDRYSARRDGSRESRPRFNSNSENGYSSRPRREDGERRPRFNRSSEEGGYSSRPRYNSEDGERRPRFNRSSEEGGYSSRPRYNSEDGERRPRFNRNSEEGGYSSRPRYNSEDGERRPRFNRNSEEGGYSSRPRYNSEDGERRPRFNRNSEGGYNSRPRYNSEDGESRPRFNRGGEHRGGDNRGGENRGRRQNGGRDNNRGTYESRPRFSRDNATRYNNHGISQQRSSITDELFVENEATAAKTVNEEPAAVNVSTKMRLNRYIAMSGVCSRREADELIKNGEIKVNGTIVTEMGVTLQKDDVVEYQGRKLQAERKVYVLLNKPKDTVTTTDDPEERMTVMDLVSDACEERIYPVGRLDRQTTGVLLLTNDGEITEKLMHPRYGVRKIYHVFLDKVVTESDMQKMVDGLTLEDGPISFDDVRYVDATDRKQVGVQIHSGRNRIVRRTFEKLGYDVQKLDRVYFAGLTKLNLPRGRWRFLTDSEISKLKAGFYK